MDMGKKSALAGDPPFMLRHGPNQPFAWLGRIDQRIEESLPVPLGERKRLMVGDGAARCAGKRSHAEIGELAPLEMRRAFDQVLGFPVEPEPEPLGAERPRHGGDLACLRAIATTSVLVVIWPTMYVILTSHSSLRRERGACYDPGIHRITSPRRRLVTDLLTIVTD